MKNKSLLVETDNPEEFNSFYMSREDESYSFRYLDTDQYACLYSVMDSEGGMHYSGSVDRYYTDEEKNKQNEQVLKREQEQIELYERLEGTWTSEDGNSFEFEEKVFTRDKIN